MSHIPTPEYAVAPDEARRIVGIDSKATFWRAIAKKRLPPPFYPAPKSPRWFPSELRAAAERLRATPTEAKEARRQARLAATR